MKHEILTPEDAVIYLREHLDDFKDDSSLKAFYLNSRQQSVDSFANIVMRITSESSDRSVILKQVLPYVRAAQESGIHMPLEQNRIYSEVTSLSIWNKLRPGSAPKIYHFDASNYIILMEDLQGMKTLRSELIKRKYYPDFPRLIGQFLGHVAFYTSDNYLNTSEKRALDKIMDHMDTDAFWVDIIFNRLLIDSPQLNTHENVQAHLNAFCNDQRIRKEVISLKNRFVGNKQCLVHKDLHTSNIFISENGICIYDSEYAGYGPISFDLGRMIGNLLLNIASHSFGLEEDVIERKAYQKHLISAIHDLLENFVKEYQTHWNTHMNGFTNKRDRFLSSAIQEGLGTAACTAVCRLSETNLCFDIKRIENAIDQARAIELTVHMSREILLSWQSVHSPSDAAQLIETSLEKALSLFI